MIEGSLKDAPISDVIQVIAGGQKTGILTVSREGSRARLYFERGRLQYGHLSPGVHLGEILVRMDLLTAHEVQEILLKQTRENAGTPLGMEALGIGLLEPADLYRALEQQILEVLTELMMWKNGSFSFSDRSGAASQVPTEHTLDPIMLLVEVAGRIEAWQQGAVEPHLIFEKSGDPTKITPPKGGWEVLGYVDGKRTAASIAAELDLAERQVYCILYELQERGVIRALPFTIEDPLVLVISSSGALQRLMRLALQRAGLRVHAEEDYGAAMAFVKTQHPRGIVVDDENEAGWEFVRELRKMPGQGHLPVLVLTGESAPSRGLFGRGRRPKARTLLKPFHEIDLQQTVTQMIGRTLA